MKTQKHNTQLVQTRIPPATEQALIKAAEKEGLTIAAYLRRLILLSVSVWAGIACNSHVWCWPHCQDAEDEALTTTAITVHCQQVGRDGPDGGHIKAYDECMREGGLR